MAKEGKERDATNDETVLNVTGWRGAERGDAGLHKTGRDSIGRDGIGKESRGPDRTCCGRTGYHGVRRDCAGNNGTGCDEAKELLDRYAFHRSFASSSSLMLCAGTLERRPSRLATHLDQREKDTNPPSPTSPASFITHPGVSNGTFTTMR